MSSACVFTSNTGLRRVNNHEQAVGVRRCQHPTCIRSPMNIGSNRQGSRSGAPPADNCHSDDKDPKDDRKEGISAPARLDVLEIESPLCSGTVTGVSAPLSRTQSSVACNRPENPPKPTTHEIQTIWRQSWGRGDGPSVNKRGGPRGKHMITQVITHSTAIHERLGGLGSRKRAQGTLRHRLHRLSSTPCQRDC